MNTDYLIAVFRSRQQALRLEAALKREGLPVRMISTPREVALGCGLSVWYYVTGRWKRRFRPPERRAPESPPEGEM